MAIENPRWLFPEEKVLIERWCEADSTTRRVAMAVLDDSISSGVQQLLSESLRGNGYITLVKDFCIVCGQQVYSNDETGHHVSSTRAIGEYHYHDKCADGVDEALDKAERRADGDLVDCEGCGEEATHEDCEGVPLCEECWKALVESAAAEMIDEEAD